MCDKEEKSGKDAKSALSLTIPFTVLDVPANSATNSVTGTPDGSPAGSLPNLAGETGPRDTSPARLSTELMLKFKTQQSRLQSIRLIANSIPGMQVDTCLDKVLLWTSQLEELHKEFTTEHAYFEVTWLAAFLNHEYFATDMHHKEAQLYMTTKIHLGRLKHALSGALQVPTQQRAETRFNSRLPDISLPKFSGDYASWPSFRELFTGLVLDNDRLTNIERLHYLRGCMDGAPAQLIAGLPLVGSSLQPSWELLIKRYENKRLLIQAQLDQLMGISPVTSRSAAALTQLISSVSEANKALESLGITRDMWDCILVYHVSRHLDRTTRVALETSLGSSHEYPRFAQLEAFVTSHARALKRIETTLVQPANASKPPPKKATSHHGSSSQPRTDSSSTSKNTFSCDLCGANHFIVMCLRLRALNATDRRKIVFEKRLCFNCLGRHNVRSRMQNMLV